MAVDPKDIGELQKALNDASGKASVLSISFITFEFYLAIAFGSVTHRNLFLEDPIKLPLLNVDLPLIGFFVVAPTVLVIFHFYVFLQLLALARKARDHNTLLREVAPIDQDRQYLRHRLDSFLMLQFLAGPREQRLWPIGVWLRVIAWISLVAAPIIVLLQGQVTFLPYHLSWAQWLQRILILIDLAVIWGFWNPVRSEDQPISKLMLPFRERLFGEDVDEVTGRPLSLFANRLVLTDQSFVDPDRLPKTTVSHSFRGRDLRQAVLNRVDLRKADFTGAMLNDARLLGADLQGAQFGCAFVGTGERERASGWPDDGCAWLQRAILTRAQLQGADFRGHLQRAILVEAQMQGAYVGGDLQGADLHYAHLEGAILDWTYLEGASLDGANLQGALLRLVNLQGASLISANLQGAHLSNVGLQGAEMAQAELQGASFEGGLFWLMRGTPKVYLTDFDDFDTNTTPWERSGWLINRTFDQWRDEIFENIATDQREKFLKRFNPEWQKEQLIQPGFFQGVRSSPPQGKQRQVKLAEFLAVLACSSGSPPYVARGLLQNGRMDSTGAQVTIVADRLRKGRLDESACPGVKGFTDTDWALLDAQVERIGPR